MRHIHLRRGARSGPGGRGRRSPERRPGLARATDRGVSEVGRPAHRHHLRYCPRSAIPYPGKPHSPGAFMGVRGILEAGCRVQHAHRERRQAHMARLHGAPPLRAPGACFLRIQPERDIPFAQDRQANQAPVRVPRARARRHPHRLHVEGGMPFQWSPPRRTPTWHPSTTACRSS